MVLWSSTTLSLKMLSLCPRYRKQQAALLEACYWGCIVTLGLQGAKSKSDTNVGDIGHVPKNAFVDTSSDVEAGIKSAIDSFSGWFNFLCCHEAFVNDPTRMLLLQSALMKLPATAQMTFLSSTAWLFDPRTAVVNASIMPREAWPGGIREAVSHHLWLCAATAVL